MNSMFDVFEKIEATSSRNTKKELLRSFDEKQKNLLVCSFHPYRQYHISKWVDMFNPLANENEDVLYNDFIQLLDYCENHNASGELVDKVTDFMARCNPLQQRWFGRVIKKDMKFGAQDKTILDVHPKLFPTFDVMLAHKLDKGFTYQDLPQLLCLERKYDGFRVLVIYRESGIVDVVGRSGKPILNKEFIEKVSIDKDRFKGFVLDGEAYSHEVSFEKFSGIMRTDDGKLPDSLHYLVFDMITVDDLMSQTNNKKYRDRIQELASFENDEFFFDDDTFIRVPKRYYFENWVTVLTEEINKLYVQFLEEGYEGAMVKDLNATYEFKRTKAMLKIKPEDKVDGKITGWYEGEKDTRLEGMFGGFNVELEDSTEIHVGGGYKDWQRTEFTNNLKQDNTYYTDVWVTIKYTEKTESGSLRHPRFDNFRDSK